MKICPSCRGGIIGSPRRCTQCCANLEREREREGADLVGAVIADKYELLRGAPLSLIIERTGPLPLARAGDITNASDLYSSGILLFNMLAGHPPFQSESIRESGLLSL